MSTEMKCRPPVVTGKGGGTTGDLGGSDIDRSSSDGHVTLVLNEQAPFGDYQISKDSDLDGAFPTRRAPEADEWIGNYREQVAA